MYMSVISLNSLPTQQRIDVDRASNTWVKLKALPSPYSYDEALLLCQSEGGSWIAWIPEYGEIQLFPGQFY